MKAAAFLRIFKEKGNDVHPLRTDNKNSNLDFQNFSSKLDGLLKSENTMSCREEMKKELQVPEYYLSLLWCTNMCRRIQIEDTQGRKKLKMFWTK